MLDCIEQAPKITNDYDLIIMPTAPTVAFKLGENIGNPLAMYLNDVCTVPINVAGLPAMSMNCGFNKDNMPIGIQLVANKFNEKEIFKVASALEKELDIKDIASLEVK